MQKNDDLMKMIADKYVERYGQELEDEMERLAGSPGISISEIRLERRVRRRIAESKRKPYYISALSVLAACFVLTILVLPTYLIIGNLNSADDSSSSAARDNAALSTPSRPSPGLSEQGAAGSEQSGFDVIPLSAPLPPGFTQIGFDQDYGKSIYHIEDRQRDDVVIVLERAQLPADTTGLVAISLGGVAAFGKQTDAYSLLTFCVDDILYTLTSRHDINTLIRLGVVFI